MGRREYFEAERSKFHFLRGDDTETVWSEDDKAYITTVYFTNQEGKRAVKYRVRENNPEDWGPD